MKKNNKRILCFSVAVVSALILAAPSGLRAAPQQTPAEPEVLSNAVVNEPIQFDVSPQLSEMLAQAAPQGGFRVTHAPRMPKLDRLKAAAQQSQGGGAAGALQPSIGSPIRATIGLGFEGVGNTSYLSCPGVDGGAAYVPPDTNAAVGDTQVVEWVNVCFAVFDKTTGALIAGPILGNEFWGGFGGGCELDNDGDIIIQWDKSNHRWLASQNDFGPAFLGPYQTCIAVSETADATGRFFRYAFPQPGFPDYPKWGLTSTIYYQNQNDFGLDDGFQGVNVCAYDATSMLKGKSKAQQVCILDNSNGTFFDDSMLPADDDSDSKKAGPEVLLGSIDNFYPGGPTVYEYVFTVDFKNRKKSTLAGINGSMPILVPRYDLAFCGALNINLTTYCVPQPSPGSELLDTLGDRLMYRLARFDDGNKQHFLVTHSVNDTTAVAARWYEFRAPEGSTSLSLYQSGQTPDDGHYRWMGSVAMDKNGDIAIGYSRSSAASGDYPSIYYAGQTEGDPLGTTEREARIKKGEGSQLNSFNRWGDYSSMALDGADSCTFWYANEYYPADGSFLWATWLASLKFPRCGR